MCFKGSKNNQFDLQSSSHKKYSQNPQTVIIFQIGSYYVFLEQNFLLSHEEWVPHIGSTMRPTPLVFLVYDVTRRDTFANLSDVWAKEVELYSTNQHYVKMLVGNKVDIVSFTFSISFTFCYKLTET